MQTTILPGHGMPTMESQNSQVPATRGPAQPIHDVTNVAIHISGFPILPEGYDCE